MRQKKLLTTALVASTIAGIGIVPAQSAEAASISTFISNALAIANDNSHGYSMVNRWGPDYDCSSFVITCLKQAGFETGGATYSGNMVSNLTAHGFTYIPSSKIDLSTSASLQAGDILMASGHTEIYIGNGKRVGAHRNYDGKTGDSSGNEINVLDYSRGSWYGILRYTGSGSTASAVTTATATAATTTSSGQTGVYKVNANLNLRSGNSTSTSILTTIPKGNSVTVTQISNGWGKTTYNGKTGWIYLSYASRTGDAASTATTTKATTKTTAAATTAAATTQGTAYKTTANLNLRSGNSTSTSILTSIPKGTSVTVTQTSGNWGKTTYSGKTGWICLDYASKTGNATSASATTAAKTTTTTAAASKGTIYKTNGSMYLRSANNKTSSVLTVVPKGTSVTVTEIKNNWGKISYGGKTGWMSLKYSTKTGSTTAAATTAKASTTAATTAAKTTTAKTTSASKATTSSTTSKTESYIYQLTSNVNMRTGGSISASKIRVLPRGTTVNITEIKNNWGKFSYDGKTGWISLQYASKKGTNVVTTITTVAQNVASSSSKSVAYSYTTTANLNLRKSYSTASARILTMPKGTALTVTEIKNNWGKTTYNGNTGWMYLQYAICTGSQTTIKNIIGTTATTASAKPAVTTSTAKTAAASAKTTTGTNTKTASSVKLTTSAVSSTAKSAATSTTTKATATSTTTKAAATSTTAKAATVSTSVASTKTAKTAVTSSATSSSMKLASFAAPLSLTPAVEDETADTAAASNAAENIDAEMVTTPAEESVKIAVVAPEEAEMEAAQADTTVEETVEAVEETVEAEEEAEVVEETAEEEAAEETVEVVEETVEAEEEAEETAEAEEAEVAEETVEAEETEAETAEAEEAGFAPGNYAAQTQIRIYADAFDGAEVLATFDAGTVLEVTDENDGWGKVRIGDQTCWIRLADFAQTQNAVTQDLKLASVEESAEAEEAEIEAQDDTEQDSDAEADESAQDEVAE